MDNAYLCHYGRKGMKWGQHIFGDDPSKASRNSKSTDEFKLPEYSELERFLSSYSRESYWKIRHRKTDKHEDMISKGISQGKFSDKDGHINSLGCLMCGFLKTPNGIVYDNFNADPIVQDAWFNYKNKRIDNLPSSSISSIYKSSKKKDLNSLLKNANDKWTKLTREGLVLSDEYFATINFVYRCEELRFLARDNHLENMNVTEDMIRNAYGLSFEEMHKQI